MTFTDPEVASVGLSEAAARARGIDVAVASADPAETARGYIHDFHCGALKLVADRERGVLIGATLVTPRAGEIVGELVSRSSSASRCRCWPTSFIRFLRSTAYSGKAWRNWRRRRRCTAADDPEPFTTANVMSGAW